MSDRPVSSGSKLFEIVIIGRQMSPKVGSHNVKIHVAYLAASLLDKFKS